MSRCILGGWALPLLVACQTLPPWPATVSAARADRFLVSFAQPVAVERASGWGDGYRARALSDHVLLIRSDAPMPLSEAVARWQGLPGVRHIEEDRLVRPAWWGAWRGRLKPVLPAFGLGIQAVDPLTPEGAGGAGLPGQWAVGALGLEAVWARSQGEGVTVAVLDTGVDATHPDLAPNLEAGLNLVEGGNLPPTDDFGHGTHVAGIVGAALNNRGVVGTAPRCRILPVRVLGVEGGTTAALIEGLDAARRRGAQVANLSLGSAQVSRIEADEMARAVGQGMIVVAAAGNEALSGNPIEYPAALTGVISVAALGLAGKDASGAPVMVRAAFSNHNPFNAVAAPGVDILSTVPLSLFPDATSVGAGYAYASGTSMASPLVAGVAALMLARKVPAAQVRARLQETARDLGAPGSDDLHGAGLVQPASAVP
ncbi:MAG: S8 family serine peptidase [Candidatus Sericytochromatia bacterium]|nr:S8 family serine peptidase [Candidatus Sericytochromatia bacterium]